jgi:hypothetical protein
VLKTLAEFGVLPGMPFDLKELGFMRRLMLKKTVDITCF